MVTHYNGYNPAIRVMSTANAAATKGKKLKREAREKLFTVSRAPVQ
jgi:hypothetical protein